MQQRTFLLRTGLGLEPHRMAYPCPRCLCPLSTHPVFPDKGRNRVDEDEDDVDALVNVGQEEEDEDQDDAAEPDVGVPMSKAQKKKDKKNKKKSKWPLSPCAEQQAYLGSPKIGQHPPPSLPETRSHEAHTLCVTISSSSCSGTQSPIHTGIWRQPAYHPTPLGTPLGR